MEKCFKPLVVKKINRGDHHGMILAVRRKLSKILINRKNHHLVEALMVSSSKVRILVQHAALKSASVIGFISSLHLLTIKTNIINKEHFSCFSHNFSEQQTNFEEREKV